MIGDTEAARRTCYALESAGHDVAHLLRPTDAQVRDACASSTDAAAVVVRGDAAALRYALLLAHDHPHLPQVVTMFDRTLSAQLRRVIPGCQVTSPADVVAPSLAGACSDLHTVAMYRARSGRRHVVRRGPDGSAGPATAARRRLVGSGQLRPHDISSWMLLCGLGGLLVTLAVDWFIHVTALHTSVIGGLYSATRVVATVGPGDADGHAPPWYLALASALMLLTIGFTALLTAGLVNRLMSGRNTAIVGRRTIPRRDHVVVVGLGQVGLRLCRQLQECGIPVVAVERDPTAANLRLAKNLHIPVITAHAEDRATLARLSLHRARALAVMGSDDVDNVEVAIAALAVAHGLRVVLRAGDDEIIDETRSLFPIGEIRDVSACTALDIALRLEGRPADLIYGSGHDLHVVGTDGAVTAADRAVFRRCSC